MAICARFSAPNLRPDRFRPANPARPPRLVADHPDDEWDEWDEPPDLPEPNWDDWDPADDEPAEPDEGDFWIEEPEEWSAAGAIGRGAQRDSEYPHSTSVPRRRT